MPGGGSIQGMITSLKNNKRSRVSTLEKLKDYKKSKYKKGAITKQATPEQLREIRERIQKENKKHQKIKIVFAIVAIFIVAILYFIFNFATF